MAAAGHMAEEDVPSFIPKNVITRSLGPHESVNVDLEGPYDAAAGDVFLLCSDGLSGQIPDPELGALLHCLTPQEAVQTLVDLANLRGGPDNISVLVARVVGDGLPESRGDVDSGNAARGLGAQRMFLQAAAIACLFAFAFCLVNEFWIPAAISAAGVATAVGLLATSRNHRSANSRTSDSIGGPYGNGPYRESSCEPNRRVVDGLEEMVDKLRNLPDRDDLLLDRTPLEKQSAAAQAAADRGDYCSAVKRYADAIRAIMGQLRQHRRTIDDIAGDTVP
jgi:protein phosphatase